MSTEGRLTVQEVLKNRNFKHASVIAGESGLNRTVKWIHIMEVTGVEELLYGGELILSTGVGWKDNKELFISFVQQLIHSGAAGICIELGTYISFVPGEIIQLANHSDFPIIVFYHKVRFIDITQDLHTLFVKKHYQMIDDLEHYSNQLNKLLLTSNSQDKILNHLQNHLKTTVVFIPIQGKSLLLSNKPIKDQEVIIAALKENKIMKQEKVVKGEVHALNKNVGELYIISDSDSISEYEKLILERTITALALNTLRELYLEEQRKTKEAEWIQKWLDGGHTEKEIERYLMDSEPFIKPNGCVVILYKLSHSDENNQNITHMQILFRSICEPQGFSIFSIATRKQLIFILVNKRSHTNWKSRIESGIGEILHELGPKPKVAVGKFVRNLKLVTKSFKTAEQVLRLKERMPRDRTSIFYDDLYIYRLFTWIEDQDAMEEFMYDTLAPVIEFDEHNHGQLMETLRIYLESNGSKKETADHLYIVRQTLYQRLQKLSELLGPDFMQNPKRQAIEFALTIYEVVVSSKNG